jgi:hypothetical protein
VWSAETETKQNVLFQFCFSFISVLFHICGQLATIRKLLTMGVFRCGTYQSRSKGRAQPLPPTKYELHNHMRLHSKVTEYIDPMTIGRLVAEFLVLSPIINLICYILLGDEMLVSGRQLNPIEFRSLATKI